MICSMLFLIFKIKDKNLAGKSDKFGGNSKNCFFRLQGPLALGGVRVPPSTKGSGEQDCRGKVEGRGLVEPW